jgi:DNA-binding IclR family transcriptional regulator
VSKTFLRGLQLLEAIDRWGPLTVTELARRTGVDTTIVSRVVTACAADDWVARDRGRLTLGPRATLLGYGGPAGHLLRRAEVIVHAVAGVTGMFTQAYGLVAREAVVLASASGRAAPVEPGLARAFRLWITAAGRAIAAQLDDAVLDELLPPDPLPAVDALFAEVDPAIVEQYLRASRITDPAADGARPERPTLPATRAQLHAELEVIRRTGVAADHGAIMPDIACLAVPWPHAPFAASLACVGAPSEILANASLVTHVLQSAAEPQATPHTVIRAAAQVISAGNGAS